MKKCCSGAIRKIHNVVIVGFILANVVLFGLSLFMYLQLRQDVTCFNNQPHTYFIQVYLVVNTLIYVVLMLVMMSVNCDGQTMTVLNEHE